MGQGAVEQVRPDCIGIWSHRLRRSSDAGHVEVAWVADAETFGVLCQNIWA